MNMPKWKIFEQNANIFLNAECPEYLFKAMGDSDSTAPDIVCYKNKIDILKIEAKYLPSQSGQIVLISDGSKFSISEQSHNEIIQESNELLNFINSKFNFFLNNENTDIKVNKELLYSWVKNMYISKGSRWLIASNKCTELTKNNVFLIPIEKLENYCEIKAVLRKKRSGTTYLPGKLEKQFMEEAKEIFGELEIKKRNNKPVIELDTPPKSLYIGDSFYLTSIDERNYFVKKRAKTNNINILFQLELKQNVIVEDKYYEEFKELLDSL